MKTLLMILFLVFSVSAEFGISSEIDMEKNNDTVMFEITSLTRYGYSKISIKNSTSSEKYTEIAIWTGGNNGLYYKILQNSLFITDSLVQDYKVVNQVMFMGITYYITLNASLIPNISDVLYVNYSGNNWNFPTNNSTLPSMDYQEEFILKSQPLPRRVYYSNVRIELFTIPSSFVYLGFFIIHLILLIIFCFFQPLKSRGIAPFLSLFMYNFQVINVIELFLTFKSLYFYLFYMSIINFSFLICIVYMSAISYFRYVMIFYLNNRKMSISENKSQNSSKFILVILKYLNHWAVTLFSITFFFCVLLGCFFILNFFVPGFLNYYLSFPLYLVFAIIIILIFLFDITQNIQWRNKTCFKEDIYFFRFEIFFLGLTIVPVVGTFIFIALFLDNGYYYILFSVFNSLIFFMGFLFQVGIILYITIFKTIRKVCRGKLNKEDASNQLKTILQHEQGKEILKEYTKKEFSIENYSIYVDIEKFKKETNPVAQKEKADKIYNLYLNGKNSELEVNVVRQKCLDVLKKIQTNDINQTLFEEIEKATFENLMDTYARFIFSSEYLAFKSSIDYLKESGF